MNDDNSTPPSAAKKAVAKQAPKKTVVKKKAKKTGAKKAASKKAEKKYSHGMNRFAPEILADLAIKLAQLQTDQPESRDRGYPTLSYRTPDVDFKDALKRAENLLLAASGETEEDVHAYQLFTEKDGLMSFDGIAQRFKEAGWKKISAGNTVKSIIEELVNSAESEVQKLRAKYEGLISVRQKYPRGLHYVGDRVKRHIRNMIRRTDLRDLFDNPQQVADVMGKLFLRLMERRISGDWEGHVDEDYATLVGFESFIEHVCGGLTYEKFIGNPRHISMDLERLGCFIHFLERLSASENTLQKPTSQNLTSLMPLLRHRDNDVPQEAILNLEACLGKLLEEVPDMVVVRELAGKACLSLRSMWEHWYLMELTSAQGLYKLVRECSFRNQRNRNQKVPAASVRPDFNTVTKLPVAKVRQTLKLLRKADNAGKAKGESMDAVQLRRLLEDLLKNLKDRELNETAKVTARFFDGTIADEMKKMAVKLEKGLRMNPPSTQHLNNALGELLSDLGPHNGDRNCRPFELFLFAAQNRLLQDKLVRRLPGFIPNPPHPFSLSILESHKGAAIAMGLRIPDSNFV